MCFRTGTWCAPGAEAAGPLSLNSVKKWGGPEQPCSLKQNQAYVAPQGGGISVGIGIDLAILLRFWAAAKTTLSLAPLGPRLTKLHMPAS
jgi:hypothetical protein